MDDKLPDAVRIIQVNDVLRVEWYMDDAIVTYVPLAMSSQVLETWADTAINTLRAWPLGKPYLALYDLSERGVMFNYSRLTVGSMFSLGLTKAGEARVQELLVHYERFTARIALTTSLRHSGHIGGLLAKLDIHQSPKYKFDVKYDVFYKKQAAFAWLKEAM